MFCNAKKRIDYKPKGNLDHYYNYGIKFRGGYNIMMQFQNCILHNEGLHRFHDFCIGAILSFLAHA